MANWNEIRDNVSRTANRAALKAGELGDTVKLNYKLHQAKGELSAAYEKLGRLTYDQLHYGHDHTKEVSDMVSRINTLRRRVRRLKEAIEGGENAVFCTACGTRLNPTMVYCPGCGLKQKKDTAEESE